LLTISRELSAGELARHVLWQHEIKSVLVQRSAYNIAL
jgi:hypothetical protein